MKKHFLFILILIYSLQIYGQRPADEAQIKADITFLASDAMKGRLTGSVYQDIAAEFIASRFQQIGLKPKGDKNSYMQTFYYAPSADPHNTSNLHIHDGDSVKIINVAGYIDNGGKSTIIIGAHYDHLGEGTSSFSLSTEGGIHNGADDNASGVSLMMQLAKSLSKVKSKYNYLFLAFSGEEFGLWGSNYFVKHPTIDLNNAAVMINLDMVGRLKDDNTLLVGGVGTSPIWKELLEKSNVSQLKLTFDESGSGPSDHTSFYFKDMPVLFYFTGQHSDYHKPSDDTEKINFDGVMKIYENIFSLVRSLETIDSIPFTKTKEEKQERVTMKVTLGIMPDYMYNEGGLRIDGVKEDRPAAHAGLKSGDIILGLGTFSITDIQTYMHALNKIEPGQKVQVKFKRDGKIMTSDVQF
ncbi:MAG: M28 family peptidase [Saprospiraceae bacterium]|nr:M28 family peptidase [Saprospiraceae bacterium]